MSYKERLRLKLIKGVSVVGGENLRQNEIPSIFVKGETLPEAWETAVLATLEFGAAIPTECDQEIDPESKDATVMITITDPLKEPRIHRNFPSEPDELYVYTQEVIKGVHDHWVKPGGEGGWSYSYHDRLCNWPGIGSWGMIDKLAGKNFEMPHVDQINAIIQKLSVAPHSRRAQAITWVPFIDAEHHEPPCLQRIWCRVVKSEGDLYLLQMNAHWRSRDAFWASFMNMYATTELQREMAKEISEVSGRRVEVGRYVDVSDSFHIPGSYLRRGELDDFSQRVRKRKFEDRVWRSDNPKVQRGFERGRQRLEQERK